MLSEKSAEENMLTDKEEKIYVWRNSMYFEELYVMIFISFVG